MAKMNGRIKILCIKFDQRWIQF